MGSNDELYGVKGVAHLYPEKESKGIVRISPYHFDEKENALYNMRMVMDAGPMFRVREGDYVKMIVDGELMMSDTGMERTSNRNFIRCCNGRVLIAGLGIGMVLYNMLDKENVTEVVVIEKYQDVMDLVVPKFVHPKLKVINADIFDWLPEKNEKFDTIYFDIWPHICTDNLDEMKKLHARFRKFLNKDNGNRYMDSWLRDFLRKQVAKEKREERRYGW